MASLEEYGTKRSRRDRQRLSASWYNYIIMVPLPHEQVELLTENRGFTKALLSLMGSVDEHGYFLDALVIDGMEVPIAHTSKRGDNENALEARKIRDNAHHNKGL